MRSLGLWTKILFRNISFLNKPLRQWNHWEIKKMFFPSAKSKKTMYYRPSLFWHILSRRKMKFTLINQLSSSTIYLCKRSLMFPLFSQHLILRYSIAVCVCSAPTARALLFIGCIGNIIQTGGIGENELHDLTILDLFIIMQWERRLKGKMTL